MNRAPDAEEGRVIELDYAPMHNGFTDVHIFRQLSVDIHVWFPSQRHPSRYYVLHLDIQGSSFTIS